MKERGIWLILLLAFGCRLYHVDFPVSGWHAWRQADTAAVARNYYENGFDFLHPQIDWGGNSPGVVEMELPLYPFLVALAYRVFQPADLWGRLLSLLFGLATIFALYRLVEVRVGARIALWAALLYAILPLNIYYSRAFMPESAMLLCTVLGVHLFWEWRQRGRFAFGVLGAVFVSLAVLLKSTSLYLGILLLALAWEGRGKRCLLEWRLWLLAALVLLPVWGWYAHAHRIYETSGLTFGIWDFGTGKWGDARPLWTLKFYNDVFFKSIAERHLTYGGFIPFVLGVVLARGKREMRPFGWWLLAVVVYILVVARGNQVHEYYQLPFIPPAVVFAALACKTTLPASSRVKARRPLRALLLIGLLALPVLSFLRVANFMRKEDRGSALFQLAAAVRQQTPDNALIVAVDSNDPVLLYSCRRKGWHARPEALGAAALETRAVQGAR
ncbi:MAG: ArnT family glycosyltransferase, partial [Candidatus Krumholzibacteriia bacterium]